MTQDAAVSPSTPEPTRDGTRVLHGVGVGRAGVVGPVATVAAPPAAPSDEPGTAPEDVDAVQARVTEAFGAVAEGLRAQSAAASGPAVEVLAATAQMADDKALRKQTLAKIAAGEGPVTALDAVVDQFATMFEQAGGYLAERVTDLRSVRHRVVARVLGVPEPGVPALTVPSVVVAGDLAPADTAALDIAHVLAIVTELGGPTSHTAIIAGQLGIPCVVRTAGAVDLTDGTVVAVDAAAGTVEIDPAPEVAAAFALRAEGAARLAEDTSPGATADGHPVQLLANIGTPEDAERAAAQAVEGSGLFRTEVLFLEAQTAPTREDQAAVYARTLRAFEGRKVVVRTLDAGADKPLKFATQPDEENPALGVRGYRLVRTVPDVVTTQLEALGDAQRETGIAPWVMAPMIATPSEARDFAAAARAQGVEKVGVMVEVPSAALRAPAILAEVDFVSIGSNDLAQYTMATDRLRGELADLISMWQPAVLDLVAATARAGQDVGKPVGVCGESASDPVMAVVLTGLGITSLSMAASAVPAVRFAVKSHTLEQAQAVAAAALACDEAPDARAAAVAALVPGVADTLGL
ncbi:phosphoenolpyruvate--protein phosphotransferase [Luteimicrobium subarcticum]|uniref:Phosphoenolpyruvate-protein phosphotransferase n=1 Tax=Luteimicrobium subarcticum TaxID=620910 RepID=A0A2M8WVA1_9MICO|nr:phosphoenolpyruvate--protein phosphotransferase [Luteimicrobium subarcticum]PJI94855.1 phosphoenolpyruvate--protein phosphotransferase [Luteimicrobium subarcticum]